MGIVMISPVVMLLIFGADAQLDHPVALEGKLPDAEAQLGEEQRKEGPGVAGGRWSEVVVVIEPPQWSGIHNCGIGLDRCASSSHCFDLSTVYGDG